MRIPNRMASLVAMTLALGLGGCLAVQAQPRTNRVAAPDFRNLDWQSMDPQQIQKMMQERMMEMYHERLEVTDDAEWKIIEARLAKVTQARMATMSDGAGLMGFGRGGPGGGGPPGGGFQSFFGAPSAESQALQQAIDSKAAAAEIKTRLSQYQAMRKEKAAKLTKAQDELRQVLTPRQEAIAVLMGLVD